VNFEAGLVQRWNGERWEEISQLERYRELFGVKIDNLAQSPDGMHFATRARNGSVRIWDLGTGKLTFEGSTDKGTWLCMALSPGGTRFALGTFHTGRIRVWDGKSGRQTFDLNGHSDGVVSLQFNHDGTRLASGSRDNSIRIWDTFSGLSLVEIKGHTAQVDHLSFSPNGLRLASGSRDGTVRIWSGHPPPQSDEAVNEDELAFRHAMWQPHPNWHSVRSKELRKSKKEFAASVQHYLFCKASAEELIEWGDLSGANRFLKEAEVARAEVRRLVKWNP
jgi:dipeptidyl aminopeptidase/acylaminoacyl peptidase